MMMMTGTLKEKEWEREADVPHKLRISVLSSTKDSMTVQWCAEEEEEEDEDDPPSLSSPSAPSKPSLVVTSPFPKLGDVIPEVRDPPHMTGGLPSHSKRQWNVPHQHHQHKSYQKHLRQDLQYSDPQLSEKHIVADEASTAVTTPTTANRNVLVAPGRRFLPIIARFRISYQAVGSSLLQYSDHVDVPAVDRVFAAQNSKTRAPTKESTMSAYEHFIQDDLCSSKGSIDISQLHENTNYVICIELLEWATIEKSKVHASKIRRVDSPGDNEAPRSRRVRHIESFIGMARLRQRKVNKVSTETDHLEKNQMKRGSEFYSPSHQLHLHSSSSSLPSSVPLSSSFSTSPLDHPRRSLPSVTVDQRCITGSTATGSFVLAVGSTLGAFLALAFIVLLVILAKQQKRSLDARRCRKKTAACGSSPRDVDNLTERLNGHIPEEEEEDGGKIFRIGDLNDEDDDDDDEGGAPEYLGIEIFEDCGDIFNRRRSSAMTKNSLIQNFQPESSGREIETESTKERKIPFDRPNINVPFIILVDEEGAFAAIDCDPDDPDDIDVIQSSGGDFGDRRFCVAAADDNDVIVDVHRSLDDDYDDDADFMNSFAISTDNRHRCCHGDENERRPVSPVVSISPGFTPPSVLVSKETGCQGRAEDPSNGHGSTAAAAVGEKMKTTERRGTLVRSVGFDRDDDDDDDDYDDDHNNDNNNNNNNNNIINNISNNCKKL